VSNKAVNYKIYTRVEDTETVRDVSETLDPDGGKERMINLPSSEQLIAHNDVIKVGELPDVNDDSRSVTAKENNDNTKEDKEKI
jgi:hypothetical protein